MTECRKEIQKNLDYRISREGHLYTRAEILTSDVLCVLVWVKPWAGRSSKF